MPNKIEDYALIGDCHTAALVGRDGSIDWLCWPHFDSPACLAALLGTPEHGHWKIAPRHDAPRVTRRYQDGTLILETEFDTPDGAVALIDFMPLRDQQADLVRLVQGRRGRVSMHMMLKLRFDYGVVMPWLNPLSDGEQGVRVIAGPDMVVLRASVPVRIDGHSALADFAVSEGETVSFVMTRVPSHHRLPSGIDPMQALQRTSAYWRAWSDRSHAGGPWNEAIGRSLLTLKALTYAPTGGVVAAPTTSLPEAIGGVRNWDYRYCWLRDATLTLLALMKCGYENEARDWRQWLERAIAGSPAQLQIMYGIAGERRLPEWEASWLPGYEKSAPVRIGNQAVGQLQLDVYGEVMDALHQARVAGLPPDRAAWALQSALVHHLESVWQHADEGIWEVRGGRQHFTYSKVMAWVALDRALKGIDMFGLPGPRDHWYEVRDKIHADICQRGFDAKRGTFVQAYGNGELDASLLMLPLVGFLPPDDPRMRATVDAIERELVVDGLVQRYLTHRTKDGLTGSEGAFLACSFWLVDNLMLQGRTDEARERFEHLLSLRNDVGLLSEEYDTRLGRQVGNFPQAFSHIALINSAIGLSSGAATVVRSQTHGARHRAGKPG